MIADVVVVGTGAGGATVARALAAQGLDVLMLEEGPDLRARPTEPTARDALLGRFRNFGAQFAGGRTRIPIIQGRLVGGSTAINSAIFWRLPESIYAEWIAADPALEQQLPYRAISDASDEIERDLSVRAVAAEVMGNNNRLLQRGAEALGLSGNVIRRAESGCKGSGRCSLGCPSRRRQGMEVTYVPQAIALGARLLPDARVRKVRWKGRIAIGVEVERSGERTLIHARKGVVLCAGAVHTPWLMLRSGLRGLTGERFTAHPGFSVAGMFEAPVGQLAGATQGYEVTGLRAHGLKFEALGLPPGLTTARLPGAGAAFKQLSDRLEHLASWGCLVRPEGHGRVSRSVFGGPQVTLPISDADCARMLIGLQKLVELFFAAGATAVLPGVAGVPHVIDRPLSLSRLEPSQLSLVATHLFGGAIVGTDSTRSVVSPQFAVHGVDRLFVADASVLPGTLGVNPQGTIMAVARVAADRIAARL